MSEEESSASSSSETQNSQVRCTGLSEHQQVRTEAAAAAATASTSLVTTQKRKAGRKKFKETRHPIFRGVRERNRGKWVCEVREPNKKSRIWLGTFPSPDMAARAYDVAALALRGKSALLNFPDSASNLPKAKSSSPRDIQVAALKAAELLPHQPQAVATSSTSAAELVNVQEGRQGESTEESVTFVDEEEMLNMPALLDSMAEGMLVTPPSMKQRFSWDDVDCQVDMSLWSDE